MDPEEASRLLAEEYSRMAEAYEAYAVPQNASLVRRLLDLAAVKPGQGILDVGCGPGNLAFEVARRVGDGGRAVGVDLAEGMVSLAKTRAAREGLRNVRFEVMDGRNLSYPRATLDVVASCLGIPSVGHSQCFAEAHRVLRTGGRFVFCVGTGGGTGSEVGTAYRDTRERFRPPNPPLDLQRLLEARQVIQATGEPEALRKPGVTVPRLRGVGFVDVRVITESHPAIFRTVDDYLRYQSAWGDNEREWRLMSHSTREAFRREFAARVEGFARPDGFAYTREVLFCVAAKDGT